jgi:hypothetical protein
MLNPQELLRVAELYAAANGISLSTLGRYCGNNRVFLHLAKGGGANIRTLQRCETYLRATWPETAPWPADLQPGPRARRATSRCNASISVSEPE